MEDSNMEKDKNAIPQEQVDNQNEITDESKNKTITLAKIARWVGCCLVIFPFLITGFGFNWFWYLVIIGVALFTFMMFGIEGKDISEYSMVKKTLIGFLVVGCIMYLWGPLNPEKESFDSKCEEVCESIEECENFDEYNFVILKEFGPFMDELEEAENNAKISPSHHKELLKKINHSMDKWIKAHDNESY